MSSMILFSSYRISVHCAKGTFKKGVDIESKRKYNQLMKMILNIICKGVIDA